jgi:hypothetical protein
VSIETLKIKKMQFLQLAFRSVNNWAAPIYEDQSAVIAWKSQFLGRVYNTLMDGFCNIDRITDRIIGDIWMNKYHIVKFMN